MERKPRPDPHDRQGHRMRATVLVGVTACIVPFGIAHALNAWAFDREYSALDAGGGSSIFERVGTAALAVAAAAAMLAHRLGRKGALALCVLLAFLALDDAFGLHKHVPVWPLVYLPLLVTIAVLLLRLSTISPSARFPLRTGLVLLAFSLVGGEVAEWLVSRNGWERSDLGYELKILAKDGGEVAGWIVVATGLIAAVVEGRPRLASGTGSRPSTSKETS